MVPGMRKLARRLIVLGRIKETQRLPQAQNAFGGGSRQFQRFLDRSLFIKVLERNPAAAALVVFDHDVPDIKLRLRKLV